MSKRKVKVDCPAWLEGLARAEWERLVVEGVVVPTVDNYTLMAGYCQSYARWRAAEEILNETGAEIQLRNDKGEIRGIIPSPQVGISNKYFDRMLKSAQQLGINTDRPSPSKHTKPPRQEQEPATDFFGDFPALN